MIKHVAGIVLSIGFSGVLFAQGSNPTQYDKAEDVQLNTITTAVPFLGITPDSRSGAMGDV
jgi:hypothetical protein